MQTFLSTNPELPECSARLEHYKYVIKYQFNLNICLVLITFFKQFFLLIPPLIFKRIAHSFSDIKKHLSSVYTTEERCFSYLKNIDHRKE